MFSFPFLSDSPSSFILCDVLTILSKIASAIVCSPISSYHADTGIWDDIIVEAWFLHSRQLPNELNINC